MRGGKREGAGRPRAVDGATKAISVRLTPEQHKAFIALGGSRWLKRMLEGETTRGAVGPKEPFSA